MDQLTNFLVYNKTPTCKNSMNYEALITAKKEQNQKDGDIDKRLLLLSPDLGRMTEGMYNIFCFFDLKHFFLCCY